MFELRATEVVIILGVGLLFAVPLVGTLDAALTPDARWRAADQSKLPWVALLAVLTTVPVLGVLAAAVYWVRVRPALRGHAPSGLGRLPTR